MTGKTARVAGGPVLDLLEEASHLLRRRAGALLCYYAGSLPFILGLLYFWSDMSRSAFAAERCALEALGLAAAFASMKAWQSAFCQILRAELNGAAPPRWGPRRIGRLIAVQTCLQPTGFVAIPVALAFTIPFGWAFAFYQSLTVQGDGESGSVNRACVRAARQAALWPGQNHKLLGLFLPLGLLVFLNVVLAMLVAPELLKMLLGMESWFTMSGEAVLNTTFLSAAGALAYLCFDPLVKAAYVLRCHYGESIQSGEDLKAELARLRAPPRAAITAAVILAALITGGSMLRAEGAPPGDARGGSSVDSRELDQAISDVLSRPEFSWRMPREARSDDAAENGLIGQFIRDALEAIGDAWRWLWRRFREWIGPRPGPHGVTGAAGGWMGAPRLLWLALLALVAGAAVFAGYRALGRRGRRPAPAAVPVAAAAPDVRNEDVTATQLPEDGWTELARELFAKGETRLGLRALYLGSLAGLAGRGWIAIARFKSNDEYRHELGRRAHAFPGVLAAFREIVAAFDQVWYGVHPVTEEVVSGFRANLARLRER